MSTSAPSPSDPSPSDPSLSAPPPSAPSAPAPFAPAPNTSQGRGMVISGAIILSIGVLVTVAALIYVITGLSTPGGDQAMSMIFVFILLGWLFFGAAPWYLGLVLIGLGRRKQRGPVRGEVLAWILACAVYPVVTAQLSLLMGGTGNEATFLIFVISIPVLIVVSWVGAALLIWGKPKASQRAVVTTAS